MSDSSSTIRVLIVDDQHMVRSGFSMMLSVEDDVDVVGEAPNGQVALEKARELRPDVILMDVQMPVLDGIAATAEVVRRGLGRVVILTTFDRDDYLFQALDAGASGFLLKNAGPEQLVEAVRVAAAGDALLAPAVTRRVIERFARTQPMDASPPRAFSAPGIRVDLTERESEVLRLLADARSNAEIAAALYIGEATVKTHVSNLLQKLGVRDRVAAVVYAHRHGLA